MPEEEEESHSSSPFLSEKSDMLKSDSVTLQNIPQPPHFSFTHSVNSLGIPLVPPSQSRLGLPDRRHIDLRDSLSPSHLFQRPSGNPNPAIAHLSVASTAQNWNKSLTTNPGRVTPSQVFHATKPVLNSGSSSLHYHDTAKDELSRVNLKPRILGKFECTLEHRKETGQNDSLNTEELSALLPGSRKPLSSGTHTFERNLHSSSLINGSDKNVSVENAFLINCNNSVHGKTTYSFDQKTNINYQARH